MNMFIKYILTFNGISLYSSAVSEPVYDPENCEANGGVLLDGRFCIQHVGSTFTWNEAQQDAEDNGGVMASVFDASYQQAMEMLLEYNQSTKAWIGVRGVLQHNPNAWDWITPCCGVNMEMLELYDQGCYSESILDREIQYNVNLTGLPSLTPALCVQQCDAAGFIYAALQTGRECYCGNTFGSRAVVPTCTIPCSYTSEVTCGGYGANRIYRVGGAYSPWWQDLQPDNDQSDTISAAENYEYCATFFLHRNAESGDITLLGLNDRLCSDSYHFACEVYNESSYCDGPLINDNTTCLHINSTLQLSWYKARRYCQSLDVNRGRGDLVVLYDESVYNELGMHSVSLSLTQVWVGLTKNPWSWNNGEPLGSYNNFAADEPVSKLRECVAMDTALGYEWITHACNGNAEHERHGYFIMTEIPTTPASTTSITEQPPGRTQQLSNGRKNVSLIDVQIAVIVVVLIVIRTD